MRIGGVNATDFDVGIGWQTKGNYGGWKSWMFSAFHNQYPGHITKSIIGMFMITILGFYVRVHLFRPDMTSKQWVKADE